VGPLDFGPLFGCLFVLVWTVIVLVVALAAGWTPALWTAAGVLVASGIISIDRRLR
jgi:FtsH-binding integral membrane protein